ncbi:MAG: hypothetical protein ACJ8EE_17415 [Bradyrhizobium sp.]
MPTATAASKIAAPKPVPAPNGDFYQLIDSVRAEAGSRSIEELEAERDEVLLGLIELRNKVVKSSQTKSTEPVA